MFVKSSLWGRRRDVHTVLGCFEPGLETPWAKTFSMRLSGLCATKLRYGGHERGGMSPGICKFPTRPDVEELGGTCLRQRFFRVFVVSFVTSIYPFLLNRVRAISMNMAEEPQKEAWFGA